MRIKWLPVRSYAVGFAAVVAATALRWALDPHLGDTRPEILLFGAVAFAVWYGGVGPAVAAAVVGYFACQYLFADSAGTLSLDKRSEAAAPGRALLRALARKRAGQDRVGCISRDVRHAVRDALSSCNG